MRQPDRQDDDGGSGVGASSSVGMMSGVPDRALDELIGRRPELAGCVPSIRGAYELLAGCLRADGRVYLAGNGGSASDAEHWAGEMLKGFEHARPLTASERSGLSAGLGERLQGALAFVPLTGFVAARTAFGNDVDGTLEFAQLVHALGRPGDVLIGITTSGGSRNVLSAAEVARARGMRVLGLTGSSGGSLGPMCDVVIRVPATRTLLVQELHLPVYHCLSLMLEEAFFGDRSDSH